MLRKLAAVMIMLMALPLMSHAQETAETSTWRWPETGIRFEYPADWTVERIQGFEFVLQSTDAIPRGMGLQVFPLQEGDTLPGVFESFAEELGIEAEAIELGGVDAMKVELPEDSGRQSLLVGYSPDETSLVLISFSGATEIWDDFSGQIDQILDSTVITLIALDSDTLNEQMLTNFEADQILSVGEADAAVRVVEVIDFSCPHCGEYALSINRLIQDYVSTGDVKLELHLVTFVGEAFSVVAANAQYCAASLGFGWDMHDLLFDLGHTEGISSFTNENLAEAVNVLDANTDGFADCLESGKFVDMVVRDSELAEDYDVEGTPSVLVGASDEEPGYISGANGEPIRGGVRLVVLYQQVDSLLPTR